MILRLQPLLGEHREKERRERKVDAGRVKVQIRARKRAERRAEYPVKLVKQRDTEALRAGEILARGDERIRLVRQRENEIRRVFPAAR